MEFILLCKMLHRKKSIFIYKKKKDMLYTVKELLIIEVFLLAYDVGWPGSVHDAKVYRNSYFYANRSTLIKGNDFLIGDSAYPLSPFLIKPFSKPNENQTEFNCIFSSHRIVVEHTFGRIKNRFTGTGDISVKKIYLLFQ